MRSRYDALERVARASCVIKFSRALVLLAVSAAPVSAQVPPDESWRSLWSKATERGYTYTWACPSRSYPRALEASGIPCSWVPKREYYPNKYRSSDRDHIGCLTNRKKS